MKCEHNAKDLVGSSDGIFCKNCGRKFVNFAEIQKDRDGSKSENLAANSEFHDANDKDIKKSKTEAVPAKESPAKAPRTPRKKAVSKG